MGRHAQGFALRRPKGRKTWLVRFRIDGEQIERSTGCDDKSEARKAATRIYADEIQRAPQKRIAPRRGSAAPLDDLIATWLDNDKTLDPDTARMWESYGRHWLEHFDTIADITDATCVDYRNDRLAHVQKATVRKELGALRRFLAWARERNHIPRDVSVPAVPKSATGTRYPVRRRVAAPEGLTVEHIEAWLAALPQWSTSRKVKRFPIRARFAFQYWTGLRPSTIDAVSVPEHWQPGSHVLRVTDEIDKARYGRELPLSPDALAALKAVAPEKGLVFGRHDYRDHVRAAAQATMPADIADVFTGCHTRSARTTHLLAAPGVNLLGVSYLVGHLKPSTTALYARQAKQHGEAALAAFEGQRSNSRGGARKRRSKKPAKKQSAKEGT